MREDKGRKLGRYPPSTWNVCSGCQQDIGRDKNHKCGETRKKTHNELKKEQRKEKAQKRANQEQYGDEARTVRGE